MVKTVGPAPKGHSNRGDGHVLFLATVALAAAAAAQDARPPACVPAARDDPAPWIWNSHILAAFPPDTPKPEFAGAFGDGRSRHELHLWRDSRGVFGEFLSPVLDADSPTSRLYDPHIDPGTGAFEFTVRFKDGERRFTGAIRSDLIAGDLRHAGRSEPVTWARLHLSRVHGAAGDSYTSRVQFECAMDLFHRY